MRRSRRINARKSTETRTLGDLLYANQTRTPMSEKDWVSLVRSIAGGDQGALRTIYEQTHRIVFTLMVRITKNRETAEEVTVDVFHDVWRRASTYDPSNGPVIGWIMNQARSRAIDRLRFEQRKKRVNNEIHHLRTAHLNADPHGILDTEEQGCLLKKALHGLNPEERQVIEIAFFSEMTYQEVAATLNQPLGTVKSRIRSGLVKLRRALAGTLEGK